SGPDHPGPRSAATAAAAAGRPPAALSGPSGAAARPPARSAASCRPAAPAPPAAGSQSGSRPRPSQRLPGFGERGGQLLRGGPIQVGQRGPQRPAGPVQPDPTGGSPGPRPPPRPP